MVRTAGERLVTNGAHLLPAAVTSACLGVGPGEWQRFGAHWEELKADAYAAALGTRRLRRYGQFTVKAITQQITPLPQSSFVQPQDSNPLYVGVERTFEPLTPAFAADPVLLAVLRLLAQVATALDDPGEWNAKVHPFRVIASGETPGLPTPEGRHRDGVTLVSALLVGRQNAAGGESSVYDLEGRTLLTTTLSEPGALLLGDDRRTQHSVSPVQPVDRGHPAYRDVLVATLTPS